MEHYDTAAAVEYETDDEYRACLLACLQVKEFGSELVARIDALREATKGMVLGEKAKAVGEGFDDELQFFMLFSYDHFKDTHSELVRLATCCNNQSA